MQPISVTYHFLYLKETLFQAMYSWFNCAPLCCRNSKTMLQRTPGKMPGMLWWGTRRWSRRQLTEIRIGFVIGHYYCWLTSYGLNTICIMFVMPRSGWSTMAALTLVLEKHWINWWGGCSWWVPSGWVLYLSPRSTGSNGQEWDPISTPLPGTAH